MRQTRDLVVRTRVAAYVKEETTAPIVVALILAGADLETARACCEWMQSKMLANWRAGRVVVH